MLAWIGFETFARNGFWIPESERENESDTIGRVTINRFATHVKGKE